MMAQTNPFLDRGREIVQGKSEDDILAAYASRRREADEEYTPSVLELPRKHSDFPPLDPAVARQFEERYVRARLLQNYAVMKDLEEAKKMLAARANTRSAGPGGGTP